MQIKVENISFAHDSSKNLSDKTIDDISIEFEKGKFYSILGPNGSGKTTFLDLLIRYLEPDSGKILFDNKNINLFSQKEIAKKIALVSQDYYINLPYTVKEIVTMGRHPYLGRFDPPGKEDVDIINTVAEITEIQDLLTRKITCLSGGEKQRAVFARALCQKTPVLLLDEAFSNMDISHSVSLLKIIKEQVRERKITIISVFHDVNSASIWSDKMIFIKKGKIIAAGAPGDVMTEKTVKKVYNIDGQVEYNKFANAKQVYFKTT